MDRTEIAPHRFRRVMSKFASGVTVITADDGIEVRGMTATAFMSGSLKPPLCIVSVAKRAHMHSLLMQTERFGVNILADGQEDCSEHFAGRPKPGLAFAFDRIAGAPLLADSCGRIAAEIVTHHDCGDHTIFIGHILHMEADGRSPLVYHSGRYGSFEKYRGDHDVGAAEFW